MLTRLLVQRAQRDDPSPAHLGASVLEKRLEGVVHEHSNAPEVVLNHLGNVPEAPGCPRVAAMATDENRPRTGHSGSSSSSLTLACFSFRTLPHPSSPSWRQMPSPAAISPNGK
eukprot:CAMPEP_0204185464 /NCGR_PEP_ID=MMETSP0361-20130328/55340_1 /ASSEMBLY_ACC=CAM_ASM_000343 /TAXON_ID=268821 /ORGANISM="Scrippsiella Hangoei, Strain SHTV-5" /LENGTH=113 /DNA_ID=CAMNT_0051145651 /DNA_START=62 /DNA_END=400 /DNA_ORIENTATION=+